MILSRKIAAKNQYLAIDVLGSLSPVMSQIVPNAHSASVDPQTGSERLTQRVSPSVG
jgi:flagellar biosynthesis/type III secretory pathway ATPase